MTQKPKKSYMVHPLIPVALGLALIIGIGLYFSTLPIFLAVIGVAIGIGLLIVGGYYGYKMIRKAYHTYKDRHPTQDKPISLSEPKKEYVYTPKSEPQAEAGKYTPSKTANQHKKLPPDVLKLISQNLNPREVALLKQTNKTLDQDISFKDYKPTEALLKHFGTPDQTFEEKLALFKAACAEIKKTYPQILIDACGIHALAVLPVLNLNDVIENKNLLNTDYIDYLEPKHLKGHKAMRGVDKLNRPFISVCIDSSDGPYVQTLFQRYPNYNSMFYQVGGQSNTPGFYGVLELAQTSTGQAELFNCLADLLHGTHKTASLTDQRSQIDQKPPLS